MNQQITKTPTFFSGGRDRKDSCRKRPGNKGNDFSSPCGALCRNRHEPRQQRSEQFLLTPSLKKKWGPATCEPLSSATCNSFRWRWLTSSGGANLLGTGAKFFQLWRAVTISFWQRSHEGPSFFLKNPSLGPFVLRFVRLPTTSFHGGYMEGPSFLKKISGTGLCDFLRGALAHRRRR